MDVWLEYVQFCIGGMGQIDGISHIRDVFERALGTAGLHVSAGSSLWEAYREFENALMSGYMVSEMCFFFPQFSHIKVYQFYIEPLLNGLRNLKDGSC